MPKPPKEEAQFLNREFRVPPMDIEAEQSILGAMMLQKEAVDIAMENLTKDDFYREAHQKLFKSIVKLHEKKESIDVITLTNELKRVKEYDTIGGISALTALIERVPTAANAEYYAQIVKEKSASRKLIIKATLIVADAYDDSIPIKDQMDAAESRIFEATEKRITNGFTAIGNIIGQVYEDAVAIAERKHFVTGIPFGFEQLDMLTEGMQKGEMTVIGARPSEGKTALALNIAWNCASGKNEFGIKIPVGFYSLEMKNKVLSKRLLSAVAKVNFNKAQRGELLQSDIDRMAKATGDIHEAPIYLDDTSSPTIFELKAGARRLKKNFDIQLLIVDYLQLVNCGNRKDTREQEVSFISQNLKALAKDLDIPILVLSQLSRHGKGFEDRKPVLSDLRESGAIEADADSVILIWRHEEKSQLVVAKQRNGPIGDVPIRFEKWRNSFESMPKGQQEETHEKTKMESKREWVK